ncbi:hypothetical protein FKW77_000061 [Venturia effusa]|uniref:Uncharacterized protein n=1 Tax=Venturia effusa TaxID=50376 RepID=A0A517L4M3_9PEZI|nr:hypothetical protein FKW77_000061 [Venturia effusa]
MPADQPILVPRTDMVEPASQKKPFTITVPIAFSTAAVLALALYKWATPWFISGAPELTSTLLLGASNGHRILPFIPLWTLLSTMHLAYSVCATSWLLHAIFTAGCWPAIFITCIFQFDACARVTRKAMRVFLKQISFLDDTIALFDIPALEIDTEVDGLMIIRAVTISLSTLTLVAHGIEVGIKLSDDMELAISCEKVTIPFFRGIQIDDCYAALKGGQYEMTFANMAENTHDSNGDALMVHDTPLLQAASAHGVQARPRLVKMTSKFTGGEMLKDSTAQSGFNSMRHLSPDDKVARKEFEHAIKWIEDTNVINECRRAVMQRAEKSDSFSRDNIQDVRAAICSQLHNKPSVPHPPERSVKVTTLRNMSPQWQKTLMHRMPMLLRMLLNPLSHFHPVSVKSITAVGSGKWMSHTLQSKFFKDYSKDNAELRRLEERILAWLSDANFAIELADVTGLAQVPFLSAFDIVAYLGFNDVMAYRTLPNEANLKQVVRLGGADATLTIPSYLLPHHEHLLPPISSPRHREELEIEIQDADGTPKTMQKENELQQVDKDETNIKISTHVRLPACFDQELLNFIAALVKATKVMELEKQPDAMEDREAGIRNFARAVNQSMKDGMKKTVVDGIVNDKLIARLVGKATAKLEQSFGEAGYSGVLPVALGPYRLPEGHPEMHKILV